MVNDGFEENFVGRLRVGDVDLERSGLCDEAFELCVACLEMAERFFEVEGEMVQRIFGGHGGKKR